MVDKIICKAKVNHLQAIYIVLIMLYKYLIMMQLIISSGS